uniref:CCHC-type domain-containing protein n=1 Tax=Anopheles funestus TaxID=62324 RepID=A0A182RZA7_ANOFN
MACNDKKDFVKSNKLCWNCLGKGHLSRFCKSKRNCGTCGKKHHTLLHESEATSVTHTTVENRAQAEPSISTEVN